MAQIIMNFQILICDCIDGNGEVMARVKREDGSWHGAQEVSSMLLLTNVAYPFPKLV